MNEQAAGGAAGGGPAPDEERLRAQLEAELKRLRVEEVLLQTVVSLINLGARRAGLAGGDDEVDLGQVEAAVDGVQALLPIIERRGAPADLRPLRDALSQLQLAYAHRREAGAPAPEGAGAGGPEADRPAPAGEPSKGPAAGDRQPPGPGAGPAERSGRLWVPGR